MAEVALCVKIEIRLVITKEGNGICNVRSVTAQVFQVPDVKHDGTSTTGAAGAARTTVDAIRYEGPRTGITIDTYVVRAKWDAQGKPMLLPKGVRPPSRRSKSGGAVDPNIYNIVDIKGVEIADNGNPIRWNESKGRFFNHKREDITDKEIEIDNVKGKVKDMVAYREVFEVVRDPKERVPAPSQPKPAEPTTPIEPSEPTAPTQPEEPLAQPVESGEGKTPGAAGTTRGVAG